MKYTCCFVGCNFVQMHDLAWSRLVNAFGFGFLSIFGQYTIHSLCTSCIYLLHRNIAYHHIHYTVYWEMQHFVTYVDSSCCPCWAALWYLHNSAYYKTSLIEWTAVQFYAICIALTLFAFKSNNSTAMFSCHCKLLSL